MPSDPLAPEDDQAPTGELPPGFAGAAPEDLRALADEGIGEGDFDGDNHRTPGGLLELYEAIEADRAGLL